MSATITDIGTLRDSSFTVSNDGIAIVRVRALSINALQMFSVNESDKLTIVDNN